jgi:stage V sporulation protein D (sporulation-specific penicillin-binding protein)
MWRIWTLFGFVILLFSAIIVRLFYWQIIKGDDLRSQAAAQYNLEFTIPAVRGTIAATDGSPLSMNQQGFLVYAQPKEIENTGVFAKVVAPILNQDEASISAILNIPGRVWVPLAHKVDSATMGQLNNLKLTGLGSEPEAKRYFPEASMAAQLLGFVGSDQNGNDQGYFGLEGYYDRELRGRDGSIQLEKDAQGSAILVGDTKRIEPEDGRSLVLWTDRTVQQIVEKRLSDGIEQYGAKAGTVTIMDPKTGGILAMASYPRYDPASYGAFDKSLYTNPIVSQSYEPGSTFKVLVMSGAVQEKAVTPDTKVDETGPVPVDDYVIHTWNDSYHGPITTAQILEYSSNVGMVLVEQKMGKNMMLKYLHAYGIGETTGIDLQEESSPELRLDRDWKNIDLATAAFGQGIAVTPIQMVRAVGAIANGGWLMEPHVVREIIDGTGKKVSIAPKKVRQVIRSATAAILTEMMISAVDLGEARWAKPAGYRVAGKTGTAQIPVAGHYDATKTIASFVGFAPADNPRFVMLVTLTEPSSSPWGSETAAPLFFKIAKDLFTYYSIPGSL